MIVDNGYNNDFAVLLKRKIISGAPFAQLKLADD
jgi:hypothetical protein